MGLHDLLQGQLYLYTFGEAQIEGMLCEIQKAAASDVLPQDHRTCHLFHEARSHASPKEFPYSPVL
jgi:hypothetical protein